MKPQADAHQVMGILEDLIRIPSVNPVYDDRSPGEGEISEYIEQRLRKAGLKVSRQKVLPGRDNIIAELRTGNAHSTLLFESHMDTVSAGTMMDPFQPRYKDGLLFGRGACDTKATLAGMIYAMEQCARHPERLQSDLILCASVDEEHAYKGLSAFMDLNIPVHGAIVGEPTELGIVVAHKGCVRFALTVVGKAAHSSVPDEGINAIYHMARIIDYIENKEQAFLAGRHHPLCGSPSISIGTIKGGQQINIVPDRCVIEIDRRIIPGEDATEEFAILSEKLRNEANRQGIRVEIDTYLLDPSLNTSLASELVHLSGKVAAQLGLSDQLRGVPYGSNASKLQHHLGIPSIVFGPGSIKQAHAAEEWVPVDEVVMAANFYLNMAQQFSMDKASGGN